MEVLVQECFSKPACLQKFFSRAYDELLLGITACRIFFFRQVPSREFFGGHCHPTSGYFQGSAPYYFANAQFVKPEEMMFISRVS